MLTVILYALIQSIVVGLFMVYVAFKNNPQDQMINLDSGNMNYLELAIIFGLWFIGNAVFSSAIFVVVFIVKRIVEKKQTSH